MDLKKLTDKAKDLVEKRGGTDSLKEDAAELGGIAKGQGSFADKAKAAVQAIKEPGDEDTARPAAPPETPAAQATGAEAKPADDKVRGDERDKRGHGGGHGHGRGGQGGGGGQGRAGGRRRRQGGGGDPAV